MKKLFLLQVFFLSVFGVCAQDWRADLEKARAPYRHHAVEIEMEHLFYPSLTATEPAERQRVWICRNGDKYRVVQYDMEYICDGNYLVALDTANRLIGIRRENRSKPADSTSRQQFEQSIIDLASSMGLDSIKESDNYTCRYLGESRGQKAYRFDYRQGEYEYTTVYFSSATGLLDKTSCVFREPVEVEPGVFNQVRVDFIYKKQVAGQPFDDKLFSIAAILSVGANGEPTPTDKYKNYQIINNISK
ncbi:MAG: hypothetical protein LBR81_01060 [Prevotellaceae bacterium]|jgi:hypothetical protein|nr:hypothetical protein [Prevotellaceae bacterium]